jgi:hypothetical protein
MSPDQLSRLVKLVESLHALVDSLIDCIRDYAVMQSNNLTLPAPLEQGLSQSFSKPYPTAQEQLSKRSTGSGI